MLNLLFPNICTGCEQPLLNSEHLICTTCRHQLPIIPLQNINNSKMRSLFYGRIQLVIAIALLRFEKKGLTQRLMHQLKYKGRQELGTFFGEWLGEELALHEQCPTFDMVIPVPLHKLRLRKRGYNQVEGFGKAMASKLNIPYRDDVLLKKTRTHSQVFKQRFKRFMSVTDGDGIFILDRPESVIGSHILLVDDIVTTGATLDACAKALESAGWRAVEGLSFARAKTYELRAVGY